jgi:hypothetical protein
MISTYTKDFFHGKKMGPDLRKFENSFSQLPDFHDEFQHVAKNIKGFEFFLLRYVICSQIWLKYFLDYHHFDYIDKKILKRNPCRKTHAKVIKANVFKEEKGEKREKMLC